MLNTLATLVSVSQHVKLKFWSSKCAKSSSWTWQTQNSLDVLFNLEIWLQRFTGGGRSRDFLLTLSCYILAPCQAKRRSPFCKMSKFKNFWPPFCIRMLWFRLCSSFAKPLRLSQKPIFGFLMSLQSPDQILIASTSHASPGSLGYFAI